MSKPILFNTEMVQAIQEGRKTVTRRLVKDRSRPPYKTGDVIWVRETWAFWPCITCGAPCVSNPQVGVVAQFGRRPDTLETADGLTEGCFLYRADGEAPVFPGGHIWRPSIHMPKAAARIFLRVTEIVQERLRESFDEASLPMRELAAEGIQIYEDCKRCLQRDRRDGACLICIKYYQHRWEFSRLWDSTIRKERLDSDGWEANPWVWVIRFERCEEPKGWPG